MPIIKSAIKRAKQTTKRHKRNVGIKHDIKEATKTFTTKPTAKNLSVAQSELDKAVKKGLLKKNTVARRKSALSIIAKNAGVKLNADKKTTVKTAPKTSKKTTAKKVSQPKKTTTKKTTKNSLVKTSTKNRKNSN